MNIIYLGAEVGSNRTILEEAGATYMGVSYWRLVKRGLPTTKKYLLTDHFNDDTKIFVHAGMPKSHQATELEMMEFAADYEEFIMDNLPRIAMFSEFDHPNLSSEFIAIQRQTVWSSVQASKFLPVWNSNTGINGLKKLVDSYLDIGIKGEDIENIGALAALTTTYSNTNETRFHAIACAKPDNLKNVRVSTASSMAWLSPMMRGETIVWDNNRIVRYPADMKEKARPRYKNLYQKAGLDFDKIIEDDAREISKLAVWSYNQLEERMNMGKLSDMSDDFDGEAMTENTPAVSDNSGVEVRNFEARNPEELVAMPVFGYEVKTVHDPDGTIREEAVVQSQTASLLQCNSCFLSDKCPAFKQNNSCAYSIPVQVKSKEQLKGLVNAIIEMQGQRVAFARFAEQMNGGYPDQNVSAEIDRLFRLIKTTKELTDEKAYLRMTVERSGSAGVMSAIFGDRADKLKEIETVDSEKVIKEINPED
jgi:hypothetical protein